MFVINDILANSQAVLAILLLVVATLTVLVIALMYGCWYYRRSLKRREKVLKELGFDIDNGVWDLAKLRRISAILHSLDYQRHTSKTEKPGRKI